MTLEDVYTRRHKKISVKRKRLCTNCRGGLIPYKDNRQHMITCPKCKGKSVIMVPKVFNVPCYHSESVFSGEADKTPNQQPGDVVISVEIKKHPKYTIRDDHDLQTNLNVKLSDLMEGEHNCKITHLDGEEITIILPQLTSSITREYLLHRVPNKGLPAGNDKGDLLINIIIALE